MAKPEKSPSQGTRPKIGHQIMPRAFVIRNEQMFKEMLKKHLIEVVKELGCYLPEMTRTRQSILRDAEKEGE